jgi:plasmid stabilization system protein ParE
MTERLIFLPEARNDIAEAYQWYEEQSLGVGMDLLRCLEASFLSIQRNPLIYQMVHIKYRRALVRRFPYSIFFKYNGTQIVIYAVFHCSQDPEKWHARLP